MSAPVGPDPITVAPLKTLGEEATIIAPVPVSPKARKREAGTTAYVLTFIVANVLVNGFSGAIGNSMALGKSYEEAKSIAFQFQAVGVGAIISIVGFAFVYGISRAMTRLVPIKALPWMLGSVLVGSLLGMGRVYGAVADVLGVDEARAVAFQTFIFTAAGGLVSVAAFAAIFRNQT